MPDAERRSHRCPLLVIETIEEFACFVALIRGEPVDDAKLAALAQRLDTSAARLSHALPSQPAKETS